MDSPRKNTSSRGIPSSGLNPVAFAPFGDVIQNPYTHGGHPQGLASITANQNTATVVVDVSQMHNHYHLAPSRKPASTSMNLFLCRPRDLTTPRGGDSEKKAFSIKILERHPYTPQTFIPIGLSPEDRETHYLVIVAPTLPARARTASDDRIPAYPTPGPKRRKSLRERLLGARPNPFTNDFDPTTTPKALNTAPIRQPKGPGEPDLDKIQAFVARGDQAVTYGPGTWHAPMVVLGDKPVEFVVVQFKNGVRGEDVQEIGIDADDGGGGLMVELENGFAVAAPGYMRAKL